MFSEGKTETYVGIVVFIGIILLTLGIIWGKKVPVFSKYNVFHAVFGNAQGVESGDPVRVHGIKKGEVTDIKLTRDKAMITFRLKKEIQVYSDARVYLEMEEIIGGKQLSLYPGISNIPIKKDEILIGEVRGDLRVFMAKSVLIMNQVDSLLGMMKYIFKENKISNLINNLEAISFQTQEMLAENRKYIHSTIASLNTIVKKFQTDTTLKNVNTTLNSLNKTVVLLDTTINLLNPVIEQLKNKESTFGKLVSDKKLYDQLIKTSTNLDSLIVDIKKNPKKYIHFSLF
ncbi:MAG: MlaD family protein [bacterium]